MNQKARAVLAICFAIVSLIITLNKCSQQRNKQYQFEHTWTPELEQQIRDMMSSQITTPGVSDSAKNAYADCCVSKIKELFPNGLASMKLNEMNDSTRILIMKECTKCATILTRQIDVWQPDFIQQIKLQFYSYPEVKLLPASIREEYVDCLTFNVKAKFPQGFGSANKDSVKKAIKKIQKECLRLVVNKYKAKK